MPFVDPPHIKQARARFKQEAGDKIYLLPVANRALDLAAQEYDATLWGRNLRRLKQEIAVTQTELERVSEQLVEARARIRELEQAAVQGSLDCPPHEMPLDDA